MAIKSLLSHMTGIFFVAIIAISCVYLGRVGWVSQIGLGTLTLSILIGVLVGNTVYPSIVSACQAGVGSAKSYFLKLGIILYGFHLTFAQIGQVGIASIVADMFIVITTFALTYFIGRKVFGLDTNTAVLLGAGNSICGAAAILATESVVKAGADKVAIAVAVIVLFGTGAIFLYPAMYHLGIWQFSPHQWGIYIGSSVHEVAQVYAAGQGIDAEVADVAVTTKMIRVMMLAPFLIFVSFWLNRSNQQSGTNMDKANNTKTNNIVIPWFALLFIVAAGINSLPLLSKETVLTILNFDNILLAMAMVALGLTTQFPALKKAGLKPILLGGMIMVWLVVVGGWLQLILPT